jgi:hypothetical protein
MVMLSKEIHCLCLTPCLNNGICEEPSIYVDKYIIKDLARLAKNNTGQSKTESLLVIARILCGEGNDFEEYWERNVYDLTLLDAVNVCPQLVNQRLLSIAMHCGTDIDYVKLLTHTKDIVV